MLDIDALIEPPKTVSEAIETLCNVLSYDTQAWIRSLTPEQAEWLCDSDLSVQIRDGILRAGANRPLLADCEATDTQGATRRLIYTLWVHLKTTV